MLEIKKAVGYARFSSDNQRVESIDAQVRAIKDFCEQNKYVLVKVYVDEAISATSDKRDQFQSMIEDSEENEFDYIVVHKLDRFARNRYDSAIYKKKLKDNGVRVLSVLEKLDDSPEAIILESVLEGMSEYYSKNLSREVRKGLNENALKCLHNGGTAPLGYDVTKEKKYVINENEAIIVRNIFELYSKSYGYKSICKILNEKNYKTKSGRPFSNNSIYEIINNEKYRGVYVYNKRKSKKLGNHKYKDEKEIIKIDGGMPKIISDELWFLCESIKNTKIKPRTRKKYDYLLTGKLKCENCNSAFTSGPYNKMRDGTKYHVYKCSGKTRHQGCNNKNIRGDLIENTVFEIIMNTFYKDESINFLASKIVSYIKVNENENAYKELNSRKKELIKQQDRLLDLYLSQSINLDRLESKSKDLSTQIDLIDKELNHSPQNFNFSENDIKKYLNLFRQINCNDIDTKRKLINLFVDIIYISNDYITVYLKFGEVRKLNKYGGDEGNRTPVQRAFLQDIYSLSY